MPGSSTKDGVLVTRPAEHGILRGITRTTLFDVAAKLGLKIEERGFSVEEAKAAREAFITLRDDDRHAGRGDRRRSGRQWASRLGRTFACARHFLTLRKKCLA